MKVFAARDRGRFFLYAIPADLAGMDGVTGISTPTSISCNLYLLTTLENARD